MNNEIKIELRNGLSLVAAIPEDSEDSGEIDIGLMNEKGSWIQDIAVVRRALTLATDNKIVASDDLFDVFVFGREDNVDYTDSFTIKAVPPDEEDI